MRSGYCLFKMRGVNTATNYPYSSYLGQYINNYMHSWNFLTHYGNLGITSQMINILIHNFH